MSEDQSSRASSWVFLALVLFVSYVVLIPFCNKAKGQIHVGATRLDSGQVKAQINGAARNVSLWVADVCNDTQVEVRIDKARVRNLLRRHGVPGIGDPEGVTIATQSTRIGFGGVAMRILDFASSGCIGAAAFINPWISVGCGGYKIFEGNLQGSIDARTPDTGANLARYTSSPQLELQPNRCGEVVIFAAKDDGPGVVKPVALEMNTPEPITRAELRELLLGAWMNQAEQERLREQYAGF